MFPVLIVALWGLGPDTTLGDDIVAYAVPKWDKKWATASAPRWPWKHFATATRGGPILFRGSGATR